VGRLLTPLPWCVLFVSNGTLTLSAAPPAAAAADTQSELTSQYKAARAAAK